MKAKLKLNTITNKKGYIIECTAPLIHCHFYVGGQLKVFTSDDPLKHKIRAKIACRDLGTNITAIQYNVACNEIKEKYITEH